MATRPGGFYIHGMHDSSPAPRKETGGPETAQESGDGFRADLPLAILQSVRRHDRPEEVLEDEDLSASLPRRLGLTGVVDSQIRRYEVARRRRERVSREDVANLLRLVLRRPDAEPILRDAGRVLAEQHARRFRSRAARVGRVLPGGLSERFATRVVRDLMRRMAGGSPLRVTRDPLTVEVTDSVTAGDRYGVACTLYGVAIETAYRLATGRKGEVQHTTCAANERGTCVWVLR